MLTDNSKSCIFFSIIQYYGLFLCDIQASYILMENAHYDITIANDIAKAIHYDITLRGTSIVMSQKVMTCHLKTIISYCRQGLPQQR